jgi:uridine kinase
MKWKLQDKSWNAVAEVEMPDDVPDIVIFEGRLFFYDERVEQYVTPTIYVVPSEFPPQSEIKSPWSPEFCE